MLFPAAISTLALWDQLDTTGAERTALALEHQLPAPWRLSGVGWAAVDSHGMRKRVAT